MIAMNIIKVLISIAAVSLLCVLLNRINVKKSRRIRQLPLVGAAIALMIVGIVEWNNYAWFAEHIASVISFLFSFNLLFMNLALMAGFVVIKLVIRPIITSVFKSNNILKVFALCFYEYDEEYGEWFLKDKWMDFRGYMLVILGAMSVSVGTYLGLTWVLGVTHSIWMYIFPCAAVVVFNEIYGYINGQTRAEYEHSVFGKDADSRRISNYYKIREVFEELLPEPLLSAHTGCEFMRRETPADMIKVLKESDKTEDRLTAEFFDINDRYKKADTDSFQASLGMMQRKNYIFFTPFYRDLDMYIVLPMMRSLMNNKKCTVICSRKNTAEDVRGWLFDAIWKYCRMTSLWRVDHLNEKTPDCEIGIITFNQIYDESVVNSNREFFQDSDFVLLIEPSIILNTGQVALSIIAEDFNLNDIKPVYCIFDRYTDGLVDTMSHVLRSEITDVVAMPVPRNNYTALSWNVDGDFRRQHIFDKQTRYLGNGLELAAIAVKNQIPVVTWYGEKKAPVKDIKWIAGQYYSTICRYMNQPAQQKSLYEKIEFVSNLWSVPRTKEQFIIAEDEFCNMFSMMRVYLSRGENQVFVNVLSESYLIRDYMRSNMRMFLTNPNAVPSLVPDYAKTERNAILKLVLMMTLRPVYDHEVRKEFDLCGIETDNIFDTLIMLVKKYTYADHKLITLDTELKSPDELLDDDRELYSVSKEEFNKYFSYSLKNAYYIVEDEKSEEEYIDARFFNHVTQTILPGQFVTYDGKYYQVKNISPQVGVLLRRASDLYDGRKYYRQNRIYHLELDEKCEIISTKKIADIEFTLIRTDFSVDTTGYLVMDDYHDLRTAKLVDLSDDPNVDDFKRSYRNKSILKIKLPETDENICFTLCLMITELFRSVFPDGWQYITAVTKCPEDVEGMLNYVVYPADKGVESGYIYIIEDSDIDLGLLDSVGKNFTRLMEIIADYLDWHFEKMREIPPEIPEPKKIDQVEYELKKRKNFLMRLFERIRSLFGGKKRKPVKTEDIRNTGEPADSEASKEKEKNEESETTTETEISNEPVSEDQETAVLGKDHSDSGPASQEADSITKTEEKSFDPDSIDDPELVHTDGTDIFDQEGDPWDKEYFDSEFARMGLDPIVKTRYQKEAFLKYGFEEIDDRIKIRELRDYLRVHGWTNNSLTLARKRDAFAWSAIDLDTEDQCDFCGQPLSGVSYEKLNDGRIRCNDCSATAITSVEEFREIFRRCLEWMEGFYDIKFRIPVNIKMTDAKEIAKGSGRIFKPTKGFTARVLGFAQKKGKKYSILIENGSPRLATIDTLVHEMTHIWQYINWNEDIVLSMYKMNRRECTEKARLVIYEGMAMWAAIQCLYLIGETYYASVAEAEAMGRTDVYGIGFRLYCEQYPLIKDSSMPRYTPFKSFPPLEPEDVYVALKKVCEYEDDCKC